MDPINPIAGNPESISQTSVSNESHHNPEKKDSSSLAVASVAIFIVLALGIIAFLYYQNQKLKDIVLDYQSKINNTPAPTIQATPPVIFEASPSATPTQKPKTATQSASPKASLVPTPVY